MATDLTTEARAGYDGNENPYLFSSPAWYAHALGKYLHDTGRNPPFGVRMSLGDHIRANDMLFSFEAKNGRITFERTN